MNKKISLNVILFILIITSITFFGAQSFTTKTCLINANVKANVYVDNEFKGTTPLKTKLTMGNHSIRLEADGYANYEGTITVKSSGNSFYYTLDQGSSNSKFRITIRTNIQAKIYLNGKYYGNSPRTVQLTSGTYNLILKPNVKGYKEYKTSISINKDNSFYFNLEKEIQYGFAIFDVPNNTEIFINNERYYFTSNYNSSTKNFQYYNGKYKVQLVPGNYIIKMKYYDLETSKEIYINENQTLSINLYLQISTN